MNPSSEVPDWVLQKQPHLVKAISHLPKKEQQEVVRQCFSWGEGIFHCQRNLLAQTPPLPQAGPPFSFQRSFSSQGGLIGKTAVQDGKVAALILAGGLATRLQFTGPKALYPITSVRHQTLIGIFLEKIAALSKIAGCALSVGIMTSQQHQSLMEVFLKEHQYFQLPSSAVSLFPQPTLPFMTKEQEWALDEHGQILAAPSGNGDFVVALSQSGLLKKWKSEGVEWVSVVLIDNPLVDPYDTAFIGAHIENQADASLKAVKRVIPEEKLGVLIEQEGYLNVREYTELFPETLKKDLAAFPFANTSVFCFSLRFLERASNIELPLHVTQKPITPLPSAPIMHKFEKFIFDLLPLSNRAFFYEVDRTASFCPLKDASCKSPLQESLVRQHRAVLKEINGREPPSEVLEVDPHFFYVTENEKKKWADRPWPSTPYVEF